MKHVKRILVSLACGLLMGVVMGLTYHFLTGHENWLKDAFNAGWFYALGVWLGVGMKFFHEDNDHNNW